MVQRYDGRDVVSLGSLTVVNTWLWNVVEDTLLIRGRDDRDGLSVDSEIKNLPGPGRFDCVI